MAAIRFGLPMMSSRLLAARPPNFTNSWARNQTSCHHNGRTWAGGSSVQQDGKHDEGGRGMRSGQHA